MVLIVVGVRHEFGLDYDVTIGMVVRALKLCTLCTVNVVKCVVFHFQFL